MQIFTNLELCISTVTFGEFLETYIIIYKNCLIKNLGIRNGS